MKTLFLLIFVFIFGCITCGCDTSDSSNENKPKEVKVIENLGTAYHGTYTLIEFTETHKRKQIRGYWGKVGDKFMY